MSERNCREDVTLDNEGQPRAYVFTSDAFWSDSQIRIDRGTRRSDAPYEWHLNWSSGGRDRGYTDAQVAEDLAQLWRMAADRLASLTTKD